MVFKPIIDLPEHPPRGFSQLLKNFGNMGGFTAAELGKAYDALLNAYKEGVTMFFAFTANLVATGLRRLFADFIKRGFVDVIVTTGGAIDHDIARGFGGTYYSGSFDMDDTMLAKRGYHRLGNVVIPTASYGPLVEKAVFRMLEEIGEGTWSISGLLKEVGGRINDDKSFLKAAAEKNVPVFSPGVVDGAFGTSIMVYNDAARLRGRGGIVLDPMQDMKRLYEIVMSSEKLGALILGGGISKHHVIWWAQFKGGLDYAVYVTTAVEADGSLSGARTKEAISWGKIKPSAKHVNVFSDATLVFPLIYYALVEELGQRH